MCVSTLILGTCKLDHGVSHSAGPQSEPAMSDTWLLAEPGPATAENIFFKQTVMNTFWRHCGLSAIPTVTCRLWHLAGETSRACTTHMYVYTRVNTALSVRQNVHICAVLYCCSLLGAIHNPGKNCKHATFPPVVVHTLQAQCMFHSTRHLPNAVGLYRKRIHVLLSMSVVQVLYIRQKNDCTAFCNKILFRCFCEDLDLIDNIRFIGFVSDVHCHGTRERQHA